MMDVFWYVLTFLAGLGTGVVVKVRFDASKRTTSSTSVSGNSQGKVDQSGNTVGGHMSGRDVNVKRD
ncbi:hypothetical protein [Mesorhizobium japonicum]|uniref:hypothetical protein n=1 Tax=Mesorhizobium japonicum TaxID=2066070 RepID=UPI0013156EDB|nr:hypothetical protein [Mesorhizobium japonicum]